jgi:hypothetical protein
VSDVSQSISLTVTPSLTVNSTVTKVTIKPDLPLQEDTLYYLLLEIKNGAQTLFSQSDLSDYSSSNSLLWVESFGGWPTQYNIRFKTTGPQSTSASAQSNSATSVTSPSLSIASYVNYGYDGIIGGTVTLGQACYVQFSKPLNVTFTPANGEYDTNVTDLKIKFEKVTGSDGKVRVLKITPVWKGTAGGFSGGYVSLQNALGTSGHGAISTPDKTFSITNLYVMP